MFYIELNNNKTLIVSLPCKGKIDQENDCVMFLNEQEEIVVFYKLSEIKGFFKDDRFLKGGIDWGVPGSDKTVKNGVVL